MGPTACTEPQCLYKGEFYFTYVFGINLYTVAPYSH